MNNLTTLEGAIYSMIGDTPINVGTLTSLFPNVRLSAVNQAVMKLRKQGLVQSVNFNDIKRVSKAPTDSLKEMQQQDKQETEVLEIIGLGDDEPVKTADAPVISARLDKIKELTAKTSDVDELVNSVKDRIDSEMFMKKLAEGFKQAAGPEPVTFENGKTTYRPNTVNVAEGRSFSVPEGRKVVTDYVDVNDILIDVSFEKPLSRDAMLTIWDKYLQQPPGHQCWPCPTGFWDEGKFFIIDGRHEYWVMVAQGFPSILVCWVE